MTITKYDRVAILPKRCDRCNRLFWLEPYNVYYKTVGIDCYSLNQIECKKCAESEEQMDSNNEVLVITPRFPMGERETECTRSLIKKQKEEGVVLLPFGYDVVVKSNDVEIELGVDKDEEHVIRNATAYICLADKNKHGATAYQIAKVLYDRAYRKGFAAGKLDEKGEVNE